MQVKRSIEIVERSVYDLHLSEIELRQIVMALGNASSNEMKIKPTKDPYIGLGFEDAAQLEHHDLFQSLFNVFKKENKYEGN